jgi:hypothetical protein
MIKEKIVTKEIIEVTDIFCDICARSCKGELNFEYMKLEAHWGYDSNHDGEVWEAQVCERCVIEQLSLVVNFKKEGRIAQEIDLMNEMFREEQVLPCVSYKETDPWDASPLTVIEPSKKEQEIIPKYKFIIEKTELIVDPMVEMPKDWK